MALQLSYFMKMTYWFVKECPQWSLKIKLIVVWKVQQISEQFLWTCPSVKTCIIWKKANWCLESSYMAGFYMVQVFTKDILELTKVPLLPFVLFWLRSSLIILCEITPFFFEHAQLVLFCYFVLLYYVLLFCYLFYPNAKDKFMMAAWIFHKHKVSCFFWSV